jgi:TPR repeat protein
MTNSREISDLIALAEGGDTSAQNALAALHATGDGIPQDLPAALDWYTRAVSHGSPNAMYNLGLMRLLGEGCPVDITVGLELMNRAASHGFGDAHLMLAETIIQGRYGVKLDIQRALHHLVAAVHAGSLKGIHRIGELLTDSPDLVQMVSSVMRDFEG